MKNKDKVLDRHLQKILRVVLREEKQGTTEKYDDDSALKGDQDELPDGLQKAIIDKAKEENEADEQKKLDQLKEALREYELAEILKEV